MDNIKAEFKAKFNKIKYDYSFKARNIIHVMCMCDDINQLFKEYQSLGYVYPNVIAKVNGVNMCIDIYKGNKTIVSLDDIFICSPITLTIDLETEED